MNEFTLMSETVLDIEPEIVGVVDAEPGKEEVVEEPIEEKHVEPVTVSKRSPKTKTLRAKVNYSKPSRNKTSISYTKNGRTYAVFIDGIFENEVEISYTGKDFNTKNIVSVK